ncbi:MAG: citrate lyase subunit alpha [Candidatus Izemoplasma sp.]|nr:citrate lyase subunit alpha [Candidatus Izemoplasma sp.]
MSKPVFLNSIPDLFEHINIHEHKHISFHHHLRNGDDVINRVLSIYEAYNVKDIHLHPSAIFPSYHRILSLIKRGQITDITTSYINGDVGEYISEYGLKGNLLMTSHGTRARGIIEGKESINIAYLAVPTVDQNGNGTGTIGPSRCGSLGYAVADSEHADIVVLITDNIVDETLINPQIDGRHVDYVITVESIGDPKGIVSGITQLTTNPIGVKIAHTAATILTSLSSMKSGFSYQSGAGGISLKVTDYLRQYMETSNIKAQFFSGGITAYHVNMLTEGLVEELYDVQCFDLRAVESISQYEHHHAISASKYANPQDDTRVIKALDFVILGATEIDVNFNCNVTTDSFNTIIGGSGGHHDVAEEANVTIVVSPLIKGRIPIVKDRVTTITTPGQHIDIFVTERGVAINPNREDLINELSQTNINLLPIDTLKNIAENYTGKPKEIGQSHEPIGYILDRDYNRIDTLYKKKG